MILDLDADAATILGRGVVTLRQQGRQRLLEAGRTVPLDVLRAGAYRPGPHRGRRPPQPAPSSPLGPTPSRPAPSREHTRHAEAAFRAAIAAGDADGAVGAVLDLDAAIAAWSADTLQSDEMDRARATLRAMVVRLGEAAAAGLRDPRDAVAPVVEAALRPPGRGAGRAALRPLGPAARRAGGGRCRGA